jgi:hypothetical protein
MAGMLHDVLPTNDLMDSLFHDFILSECILAPCCWHLAQCHVCVASCHGNCGAKGHPQNAAVWMAGRLPCTLPHRSQRYITCVCLTRQLRIASSANNAHTLPSLPQGAAPLIKNKDILSAAAGLLGTDPCHPPGRGQRHHPLQGKLPPSCCALRQACTHSYSHPELSLCRLHSACM